MPHIHTESGQHDHTASAYIFRTDFSEPKIMLHLHKKIGKYLQFGGHIELNETPWQAVVHEIREESGYDIDQLQILQPHKRIRYFTDAIIHPQPISHSTHPFGSGLNHFHTDIAYAMVTNEPPKQNPEAGESTDIIFLTKAEIAAMPDAKIPPNVRDIAIHVFDNCLHEWDHVSPMEFK